MQEESEVKSVEQEAEQILETVKELVPEEKQEELAEKVEEISQEPARKEFPVLGSLQALKDVFANVVKKPGAETKEHNPRRKGGVGITRKDKSPSKKSRKTSK